MLYVAFTMDCERLHQDSAAGGPPDWALSARSISGFAKVLGGRGFLAAYFIVPQAAQQHAELFLDLQAQGFELGVHLHSLDQGWQDHLGGLNPEQQREAIREATARWEDALGQAPRAMRSGRGSANDYTYPLLYELGYTHSSTCFPGRGLVGCRSVWVEALPHAHWTHAGNRLLAGDLPVLEVPLTTHPTERLSPDGKDPWDVRVEGAQWQHHDRVIAAALDWQLASGAPLLTCVPITHNTREYADPLDAMTRRLVRLLDLIEAEAERRDIPLVKTTIGGIREVAVREWPPAGAA